MPGLEGAIHRVHLGSGQPECQVLGDSAPRGVCGSGLVDLLSELLRTERMNPLGRLSGDSGSYAISRDPWGTQQGQCQRGHRASPSLLDARSSGRFLQRNAQRVGDGRLLY